MRRTQWRFGLLVAVLSVFCLPAVAATQTKTQQDVSTFLARAQAYVSQVKLVCTTPTCQQLTTELQNQLDDATAKNDSGSLTGTTRANFHKTFGQTVMAVVTELGNVAAGEKGKSTAELLRKQPPSCALCKTKGRMVRVDYTCGEVFEEATAICALYTVASPIAATICEGVAIYEYNKCIAAEQE